MSMAIINSFDYLVNKALDKVGRELLFHFSQVLLKIVFDVLEDKIKGVMCVNNFFESM